MYLELKCLSSFCGIFSINFASLMEEYIMLNTTVAANKNYRENPEIFLFITEDIYDLICQYFPSVSYQKYEEATEILQKLLCLWINSGNSNSKDPDLQSEVNSVVSIAAFALSAQIAWCSFYTLQTSYGMTSLTISFAVKVTSPHYVSVGIISNGFFNYQLLKRGEKLFKSIKIKG